MASYGTGYGPGLAPWWQGSTDQFTGQQGVLGPGPTELDVRKVLDALSKQRDFGNIGSGMLTTPQQGVPVTTTPVGQAVPIVNDVAPPVTQMDNNMGGLDQPMTSSVMPTVGPGGNTENQWNTNKDYILQQVEAGNATPQQQRWYSDWIEAGKPETQAEMNAWRSQNPVTQTPPIMGQTPPVMGGTPPGQENLLNQNFINFLRALGLDSLANSFSGGGQGGGFYSPLPSGGSGVGYDPFAGMYNVPQVMQPGSVAQNTGLFNYIYGPQTQPMAPYNPMTGITSFLPQITGP